MNDVSRYDGFQIDDKSMCKGNFGIDRTKYVFRRKYRDIRATFYGKLS